MLGHLPVRPREIRISKDVAQPGRTPGPAGTSERHPGLRAENDSLLCHSSAVISATGNPSSARPIAAREASWQAAAGRTAQPAATIPPPRPARSPSARRFAACSAAPCRFQECGTSAVPAPNRWRSRHAACRPARRRSRTDRRRCRTSSGHTTPITALAAIAASTACPPSVSTIAPAWDASGCSLATMPCRRQHQRARLGSIDRNSGHEEGLSADRASEHQVARNGADDRHREPPRHQLIEHRAHVLRSGNGGKAQRPDRRERRDVHEVRTDVH